MISDNPDWDQFITEHRWGVLTTLRKSATPSSSLVAYTRDADELIISTPGATFKRRSIEHNPDVSFCVISNAEPFNYVTVEGAARISTEHLLEDTRLLFANIAETGYAEPEDLPGWLEKQQRVIIRIRPTRVHGVIR